MFALSQDMQKAAGKRPGRALAKYYRQRRQCKQGTKSDTDMEY